MSKMIEVLAAVGDELNLSPEDQYALKEKAFENLTRMLESVNIVSSKSNKELAEALVALTEDLTIYSLHYQVLMECASRLSPELFDEGEQ